MTAAKTPTDLAKLLQRMPRDAQAMSMTRLDGFLGAIAVGPVAVGITEWLPLVWRQDEAAEPDAAARERDRLLTKTLLSYHGSLLSRFSKKPLQYVPKIAAEEAGQSDAEAWAQGFMEGVQLRWDDWSVLFEDGEESQILGPIIVLLQNGQGQPMFDGLNDKAADVAKQAHQLLGDCVRAIDRYWKAKPTAPRQWF